MSSPNTNDTSSNTSAGACASNSSTAQPSAQIIQLPPPQPTRPKLILHEDKIYQPVENELYVGWEQAGIEFVKQEPKFTWKGAKLPWDLWAQIVCFMRWSQEEIKEEAMLFLFYHIADKKWAAWVFPQTPSGMSVRMLPEHAIYQHDRKQFGAGWIQAGTVHHHCTAKAFQSGTDKTDEEDRDGLHVTLGEMEKRQLDIHCRQVFDGVQSSTRLSDWVEAPPWLKEIPKAFRGDFTSWINLAVINHPFPQEWKDRVYKYPYKASEAERIFLGAGATAASGVGAGNKATLIGSGTATTAITAGSQPSTSNNGAGTGTATNNQHWAEKFKSDKKRVMRAVLERHGITAEHAVKLFRPHYHSLNDEQKSIYHILRDAFMREGITLIVAPDYLVEIAEEDLLVTPHGF